MILLQQNVLRFEIAVNESRLVEKAETIQQLLGKYPHKSSTEAAKLVLFY